MFIELTTNNLEGFLNSQAWKNFYNNEIKNYEEKTEQEEVLNAIGVLKKYPNEKNLKKLINTIYELIYANNYVYWQEIIKQDWKRDNNSKKIYATNYCKLEDKENNLYILFEEDTNSDTYDSDIFFTNLFFKAD